MKSVDVGKKIEYIKYTSDEFVEKIPEYIETLRYKYHFYMPFNTYMFRIGYEIKDIYRYLKKNASRRCYMLLCYPKGIRNNEYFIVFSKDKITIYYMDEDEYLDYIWAEKYKDFADRCRIYYDIAEEKSGRDEEIEMLKSYGVN